MAATPPKSFKVVKDYPHQGAVFAVERVPESRRLVFGGTDFKVYDIDLAQEKPEAKALGAHESYVTGIALAGRMAISGGYDGRLIWWDLESRTQVRSIDAHRKWIRGVVATRDGKVVASVADDMVCRLWDGETGSPLRELRGHAEMTPHHFPSMLFTAAVSADGTHIATADKVGQIIVWEVATGKSLATLKAPTFYTWDPVQRRHSIGGIRSLTFSPDGVRLAAGGIGQIGNIDHLEGKARIEVFDWQKGERTHEFASDKFKGLVEHIEFPPEGDWLLAAGGANDGFLMTVDLKAKAFLAQEKAAMHVYDFVPDFASSTVFAAGHGRIVMFELKS